MISSASSRASLSVKPPLMTQSPEIADLTCAALIYFASPPGLRYRRFLDIGIAVFIIQPDDHNVVAGSHFGNLLRDFRKLRLIGNF